MATFGRALVSLRIAVGLTQRELAFRLGVHESLVSRDERNEYQGLTIPRAAQILQVLGVKFSCAFQIDPKAGDGAAKEHA
jgi:transcriptional regulator with XRE-family HTH domain